MAHQTQFIQDLQKQLNDARARATLMEGIIAQKNDHIAILTKSSSCGAERDDRRFHDHYESDQDLFQARHDNIVLGKQLMTLQSDLAIRNIDLDKTKQQLRVQQSTIAALHKQLQAANVYNGNMLGFSTAGSGKGSGVIGQQDDKDDEETPPRAMKQEQTYSPTERAPQGKHHDGEAAAITLQLNKNRSSTVPPSVPPAPMLLVKLRMSAEGPDNNTGTQKPAKRRRVQQEETKEEVHDMEVDYQLPKLRPRQHNHHLQSPGKYVSRDFVFTAVTNYLANDVVEFYNSKEDFNNCMEDLWTRVNKIVHYWEERKGSMWYYEFTKTSYKPSGPVCVHARLTGKRTSWRPGCEGKYACRNCVAERRPCFTYERGSRAEDGEEKGEFVLLPIHEKDRLLSLWEGDEILAIRYWLNVE